MNGKFALRLGLAAGCVLAICAHGQAAGHTTGDYVFTGDIDLAGPGFWDYSTLDGVAQRLYLSHVDKVTVVDMVSRKVIGSVAPLSQAHGVAIVASLHKGYASSGGDGLLKVFDLSDLHIIKEIPIGEGADGVIFDPHSNSERIIPTFLGGRSMAIDARTGALFITHGDTRIKSPPGNPLALRFGWDNAEVATFVPND